MCHVLIIEDDALAALDICDTLKGAGATSFSFAESEGEAVESARVTLPALITSDVMLARGSGPRAIHLIEGEFGRLPVIFITATPDQCQGCAPHPVLEKPFGADHLLALFRSLAPDLPAAA